MRDFEQWIRAKDAEYEQRGLSPMQRPFEAWKEYSTEARISVSMDDPRAKAIFDWFKRNSKDGAHQIGYLFRGAHYFNGSAYPVIIPIFLGTVSLNPFKSLEGMKDSQISQILSEKEQLKAFLELWCDCLDFGVSLSVIDARLVGKTLSSVYANSAIEELKSSVGELLQNRPNATVVERAAMAIEMLLKSILAFYAGFTEQTLSRKPFSHNLENLCLECLKLQQFSELNKHLNGIKLFPSIAERYAKKDYKLRELFEFYRVAQSVAAIFARSFSGDDSRTQVLKEI